MHYTHSITSKGQITIPKEFRDKLGLDKFGKATIKMNQNGEIILSKPKNLGEIRAILGQPTFKSALTEREKLVAPQLVKKYQR